MQKLVMPSDVQPSNIVILPEQAQRRASGLRLIATLILCTLLFSACVSPRDHRFSDVRTGMAKDEVLEIMGGPDVTRRWQGKDRWIYNVVDKSGERTHEIHFVSGKVSYAGTPPAPEVPAEEQDRRNEEENLKEEKRVQELKAQERERVRRHNEGEEVNESNYKVAPKFKELK